MKSLLLHYTRYNHWANQRICDYMKEYVNDEQSVKEIISSFSSVRKTIFHTWDAQIVWIHRIRKETPPPWPPTKSFSGSWHEALKGFVESSLPFIKVVEQCDEHMLSSVVSFHDIKGNPFSMALCDILQHVVNHSTFHRGQIITQLRQLGFSEFPRTDYVVFRRE
ncbi:MAG: DinB family protein [Bacteroidetes bacterium]|nr:DinB family protein [Bacteroidota bacterium]